MPKLEAPSFNAEDYSYRQDIRQGNFVTQEMVSQLKPGMAREQVRYVLGTPLLTDPFHGNRWDYLYRYDSGKGDAVQQRRLSVYFEDNVLARVGGDTVVADPNAPKAEPVKPREIEIAPTGKGEPPKPSPSPNPSPASSAP
jgi:outer membrane protein assembly factor BamE